MYHKTNIMQQIISGNKVNMNKLIKELCIFLNCCIKCLHIRMPRIWFSLCRQCERLTDNFINHTLETTYMIQLASPV